MSALKSSDIQIFNRAALEVHSTQTSNEFSGNILRGMQHILAGDILGVDVVDLRRRIALESIYTPNKAITVENQALVYSFLADSPLYYSGPKDWLAEPHSIADHLSRPQWLKRNMAQAMLEFEAEDYMLMCVPLTSSLSLNLLDVRRRYNRHTPEERLMLKLLVPHVKQVFRRLTAQGHIVAPRAKTLRLAQVFISAEGLKCEWSSKAREMLKDYGITVMKDILPDMVNGWFHAQCRALKHATEVICGVEPLCVKRGSRALTLFLKPSPEINSYWLVMEEKENTVSTHSLFSTLGLTARESEVLNWLAEGKSNPEIAIILGICTGTVGSHLENIFSKLGVENRFAASLMALSAKVPTSISQS